MYGSRIRRFGWSKQTRIKLCVCWALGNETLPVFSRLQRDCTVPVRIRSLTAMIIYPDHSVGDRSGLRRGETSAYYSNAARFHRLLCPLLTSATRWSPLTVRSVLIDTRQISRGKHASFRTRAPSIPAWLIMDRGLCRVLPARPTRPA